MWGKRALLAAWLAVAAAIAPATARPRPELVYHIFVRSFADSNGDHQGDLNGIRQRLGYLQKLGVTTVMLTPLYASPFYHNYFADDFDGIDPAFGTRQDFARLVKAIHARGMKIILDEEIQYVTGRHRWRQAAGGEILHRDAERRQPAATLAGSNDFLAWPGRQTQIFTVDLKAPPVQAYFTHYLQGWLDPNADGDLSDGVDGFRIDHMMDDLDNAGLLTGLLQGFWAPTIASLRARNPKLTVIAEQADWGDGAAFLARGGVDRVFAFPIWEAASRLDAAAFAKAVTHAGQLLQPGQSQLVFIENHDTNRFADAGASADRLRLGAAITMLTGWVPSIYYGQEIGMAGSRTDAPATAGVDARDIPLRLALRWQARPDAAGMANWYAQAPAPARIAERNRPGDGVSVAEQQGRAGSLLTTYRTLAALRARHPMLADGGSRVVQQSGNLVLLARQSAAGQALVLFNFGASAATMDVAPEGRLTRRHGTARITAGNRLTAPAFSATVWTVAHD